MEEKDAGKAAYPTNQEIGHLFLVNHDTNPLECMNRNRFELERKCGLENFEITSRALLRSLGVPRNAHFENIPSSGAQMAQSLNIEAT